MPIEVEISLRIPNPKIRSLDAHGFPIDHSLVRYRKRMLVPAIPKTGAQIEIETRSNTPFACEVKRSDWSEDQGLFVLACQPVARSITQEQRDAILSDGDWKETPLI
jgi:hypothetical protein